jgi:hypothetical protein
VAAANDGDIILVGAGTYNETVLVDKRLFLFEVVEVGLTEDDLSLSDANGL